MTWRDWLAADAAGRAAGGLPRPAPRPVDDPTTDLAGNDYLGLAQDPTVQMAAAHAALTWGAGAGSSPLVNGSLQLHAELESELAAYLGQPSALVVPSAYLAPVAVLTALADASCRVVLPAGARPALVDGARLSGARVAEVPHAPAGTVSTADPADTVDPVDAVRRALVAAGTAGERSLVVVESVGSVLGDAAPLAALAQVCEEHDALLIVDESHALGVHGPGLVAGSGLAGLPHVLVTTGLSEALGSQGGAVLGPEAVREHLVARARPLGDDAALAPAPTAAALAALRLLHEQPELATVVRRRVAELAAALAVPAPAGAALSLPMSSPQAAVAARAAALAAGVRVGCVLPPDVPGGGALLRITASAAIDDDAWRRALDVLQQVVKEHG